MPTQWALPASPDSYGHGSSAVTPLGLLIVLSAALCWALANLVTQAVRRGDVVIVIDPKNSRRLKRVTQRACEDWRDADTFLEFHPAFPEAGVRLDFTFNWQKPTEIA